MPYRSLSLTLLQLATTAALIAADPVMAPTPAKPPRPVGPDNHLVDRVIPAYGMNVMRSESGDRRGYELYHRAHAFVGEIESKVMDGSLRRVGNQHQVPVDDKGRPKNEPAQLVARQPLVEEQQLLALWDELTKLEVALRVPGSAYAIPEQAHLDAAFSELARAAESLRLGLGDDTYTALEGDHRAWLSQYAAALAEVRAAKVKELMTGPKKMSQRDAEAAVKGMDLSVSSAQVARMPAAPALAPTVAPAAPAAPDAPGAAPAPASSAEPAPADLPAASTPAEQPASVPVEPAPGASEAPAEAAPAEAAPAEAAPAEAAPAEAAPAEAAPAASEPPAPAAEPSAMDVPPPAEPVPAPEAPPAPADIPTPVEAAPTEAPVPAPNAEPGTAPDL